MPTNIKKIGSLSEGKAPAGGGAQQNNSNPSTTSLSNKQTAAQQLGLTAEQANKSTATANVSAITSSPPLPQQPPATTKPQLNLPYIVGKKGKLPRSKPIREHRKASRKNGQVKREARRGRRDRLKRPSNYRTGQLKGTQQHQQQRALPGAKSPQGTIVTGVEDAPAESGETASVATRVSGGSSNRTRRRKRSRKPKGSRHALQPTQHALAKSPVSQPPKREGSKHQLQLPPPQQQAQSAGAKQARERPKPDAVIIERAIGGAIPAPRRPLGSKSSHSLANKTDSTALTTKDGRRTPEYYRRTIQAIETPSQLSLKSISEYYNLPDGNLQTAEDVFLARGYKKLNKIDEGAFGIVSKAVRLSDKLTVAVKEVDLRRKRAKRIEEMKRELFVLQKINSPNVVKLIEHFIIGQMLVIIMEFCAGSNLTTYLKENAVTETEAIILFRQMAHSIKVLHRKGIAHRDVKLNNFLLDSSRRVVKVGDFGLSVVTYRQTYGVLMAKTYCGTEPYMAPEILKRSSQGMRSYNPLYADVWSLGICLFAMLTRTFPFKMHTSQAGLLKAQVERRWRFPRILRAGLTEEIKDLVWHMLDPEPERRITINGVVTHPWLNRNQPIVLSYEGTGGKNSPLPSDHRKSVK